MIAASDREKNPDAHKGNESHRRRVCGENRDAFRLRMSGVWAAILERIPTANGIQKNESIAISARGMIACWQLLCLRCAR